MDAKQIKNELSGAVASASDQINKLEAINAKLLEALRTAERQAYKTDGPSYVISGSCMRDIRTAIKRATQETDNA